MSTATKESGEDLITIVKIEDWCREREEFLLTEYKYYRRSDVGAKRIDLMLYTLAESKKLVGMTSLLWDPFCDEMKAWNKLKSLRSGADDVAIEDAMKAVKYCLNIEKRILQNLKAA